MAKFNQSGAFANRSNLASEIGAQGMTFMIKQWGAARARIASAAALAIALLAAPPTRAWDDSGRHYLALGDSVAFGYNPLLDFRDENNFIGYPARVTDALDDRVANVSCPGETSSHFIALTGVDRGCGAYRKAFPLHHLYTTSQLDFADTFLQTHPETHVVSLDIGANDLFLLEDFCGGAANAQCILAGLPALQASVSSNLDVIYGHIRNQDGYRHKLVALTYYSLNYADPTTSYVTSQLNAVVAARTQAWGGVVADGFAAFANASALYNGDTCAAGLRIVTSVSPLKCDIHPTQLGRRILARAILEALREGGRSGAAVSALEN